MKKLLTWLLLSILFCSSVFSIENKLQQIYFMDDITCSVIQITKYDTDDPSSRIASEQLKERLLNNYNASLLDSGAAELVEDICKAIDSNNAISRQKEQLKTIVNAQKSAAINAAIPNPINLIGTISFTDPVKTLAGLIGTVSSSLIAYKSAIDSINIAFDKQFFALNEKEIETLNEMKIKLFKYNSEIGNERSLTNEEGLSREELESYCDIISEPDSFMKRQKLNASLELYKFYPDFWLEKAIAHHECEEWDKSIECIEIFINNFYEANIFRRNQKFATALINCVDSLAQIYANDKSTYISKVVPYLELIEKNSSLNDWESKYFCALVYLSISDENESEYLFKAYDLLSANVRNLMTEQEIQINNYLQEKEPKKDDYKKATGKNDKDAFDSATKAYQKTLPPYNAALRVNFNTLWDLTNTLAKTPKGQTLQVEKHFYEIVRAGLEKNAFFLVSEKKALFELLGEIDTVNDDIYKNVKIKRVFLTKDLEITLPLSMVDSSVNNTIYYASSENMDWLETPIEGTTAATGKSKTATVVKISRKGSLDESTIKLKIKNASMFTAFSNYEIYATTINPKLTEDYFEGDTNNILDYISGASIGIALGLVTLPIAFISTPVACTVGGIAGTLSALFSTNNIGK